MSEIKDQLFKSPIILGNQEHMPKPVGDIDSFYSYEKSSFYNVTGKLIEIGKFDCEENDWCFSPDETHSIVKTIIVPSNYDIVKVMVYLSYGEWWHIVSDEGQQDCNNSEIYIHKTNTVPL